MSIATALGPKPARTRTRKPGDQATKGAPARVAKSADSSLSKVSFYLPRETADKLAVAARIRRIDQSDLAAEVLGREFSSVVFYEKAPASTRPADSTLTVSEIGSPTGA